MKRLAKILFVTLSDCSQLGDYTDNFVVPVPKGGASGGRLFVAWSDRRINVPQPFQSSTGLK